ncbi:FAD-binding oxidoreductase [Microvirga flavescens]|uniref:FAD-dependent oxidoreductase n=1 Tax=Microvirga flavescens TaxID=2249811 RepID=UPI00315E0314
MKEAAAAKRPFCVAGERHSMGGQSIPRNGTAVTLATPVCRPEPAEGIYRVHAGARWKDVIAALDPLGFSPAVMQSNNDFGVASTFSVNAHGWPVPYGPFGSTVRSFRIMLSGGTILTCSRSENSDLFGLVMGGYGLFGVILDLDVEMVANRLLKPTFKELSIADFAQHFIEAAQSGEVSMAYGRLSVAKEEFLQQALLVTYRPQQPDGSLPPAQSGGTMSAISRDIYRAQTGSERFKKFRWFAETVVGPTISSGSVTRNSLMNEPVSNLRSSDSRRTDILHEYFVPPHAFAAFVEGCRGIILRSRQEFMNVTLRYVGKDETSTLAFAPAARIAAVMSFSQEIFPEAEADMMHMTEALIDLAIGLGGSFYLPYRLHARRDQVEAAYPRQGQFIDRKRHYDPGLLFRNLMWDEYFSA